MSRRTVEVMLDVTDGDRITHGGDALVLVVFRWSDETDQRVGPIWIPRAMVAELVREDADVSIAVVRAR